MTVLNEKLIDYNTRLECPIMIDPKGCGLRSSKRAVIATEKVDDRKRGKPMKVFASFCPFCGVSYDRDAELRVQTERIKMFQNLLKEWLKGPYNEEYGERTLSILENLKNFARWLDSRGLTLHEAESGDGTSVLANDDRSTPISNANT